jgi:hypothetical protein
LRSIHEGWRILAGARNALTGIRSSGADVVVFPIGQPEMLPTNDRGREKRID